MLQPDLSRRLDKVIPEDLPDVGIYILNKMTAQHLRDMVKHAHGILESKEIVEKEALLGVFEQEAQAKGFSLDELFGKRSKTVKGQAKYRNPESGETWSGRGRAPQWINAAKKEGRKLEDFVIQTDKSSVSGTAMVTAGE